MVDHAFACDRVSTGPELSIVSFNGARTLGGTCSSGWQRPEGLPSHLEHVVYHVHLGGIMVDPTPSSGPAGPFLLTAEFYKIEI